MRLLAPAGSYESVKEMLNAGANDIYLGAYSTYLKEYTFNGRSRLSSTGKRIQADFDELKRIIELVHSNDGKVLFLANTPFVNEDISKDKTLSLTAKFKEYVQAGADCGVDGVILGDIGAVKLLKDMNIDLPIIVSSYLEIQNTKGVEFFKEMGVDQVILSYQIQMDEIIEISKNTSLKIEVFGHGGCSFYVGSCNLFHNAGEDGDKGINVGYPCRGVYCVKQNGSQISRSRFLDGFKICSFCSIPNLIKAGVYTLKIVGRDLDIDFICKIVSVYRKAIDTVMEGKNLNTESDKILPVWWKKMWCKPGTRCRYL